MAGRLEFEDWRMLYCVVIGFSLGSELLLSDKDESGSAMLISGILEIINVFLSS